MRGQSYGRLNALFAFLIWAFVPFFQPAGGAASAIEDEQGVRIRFNWGGSEMLRWNGKIVFGPKCELGNLKILGMERDQPGRIVRVGNRVQIELASATRYAGFEVEVTHGLQEKIRVNLVGEAPSVNQNQQTASGGMPKISGEFALSDLRASAWSVAASGKNERDGLKGGQSRMVVARAPGDDIKFLAEREALLFSPGEEFTCRFGLSPLTEFGLRSPLKLQATLKKHGQEQTEWTEVRDISQGTTAELQFFMPTEPGVYRIDTQLTEASKLPFTGRSLLASRQVEFVVVDPMMIRMRLDHPDNRKLVFETDAVQSEWIPRLLRFKNVERFGATAQRLLLKHLPIPSKRGDRTYFEVDAGSWKVFPIRIEDPSRPHLIEFEYQAEPDDVVDAVLLDCNRQGEYDTLVCESFRENEESAKWKTGRLLSWTRSANPVLMIRHAGSGDPLRVSRLRAFQLGEEVENYVFATNQNRRLLATVSASEFESLLAIPKTPEANGIELHDWASFVTGGERLVRLLKNSGYQGAVVDVDRDGATLFPSAVLQSTPALDTGIFSQSGRDPFPKDINELLYRQFDSNNLTLIARLSLPTYIAKLEELKYSLSKQEFNDLRIQSAEDEAVPIYNVLNPWVQRFIQQWITEYVGRYANHPSFGGVVLQLGGNQQLAFGAADFGYNKSLIDDFIAAGKGNPVSGGDSENRPQQIYEHQRNEFLRWRASQFAKYLGQLNEDVKVLSRKRLFVDSSRISSRSVNHASLSSSRVPALREPAKSTDLLIANGIDPSELGSSGLGMFSNIVVSAALNHADRRNEFALRQRDLAGPTTPETVDAKESETATGGYDIQRIVELRRERFEDVGETITTRTGDLEYFVSVANSNLEFRKSLVQQIAKRDCLLLVDQSRFSSRAWDSPDKRVWQTFTRLPNIAFDSVTQASQDSPVVVRKKSIGNKSYLYVANQSPWPARVSLTFSSPIVNLRSVNGEFFSNLQKGESESRLTVDLQPFDLVAGVSDQKELKCSGVQASLPNNVKEDLALEKDQLLAKIRFLPEPKSIVQNTNAEFDEFDQNGAPSRWAIGSGEGFSATTLGHGPGRPGRYLRIRNQLDNEWGWIRSSYLKTPRTGRLSLVVSMKSEKGVEIPRVRLSIEGTTPPSYSSEVLGKTREYYRFGVFAGHEEQPEASRITSEWKIFAVHFNDVPTNLSDLRVGLDVFGKGAVRVDNVRVFDRWFDAEDKRALTKLVTLAGHKISEGELLQAHELLNGYWPQFLRNYPVPVKTSRTSAPSQFSGPVDRDADR